MLEPRNEAMPMHSFIYNRAVNLDTFPSIAKHKLELLFPSQVFATRERSDMTQEREGDFFCLVTATRKRSTCDFGDAPLRPY